MRSEDFEPKEVVVSHICEICDSEIYEGEHYYDMPDAIICDSCLRDWANEYHKISGEE